MSCFERSGRAGIAEEQRYRTIRMVGETRGSFPVEHQSAFETWRLKHHCREPKAVRVSGTTESDIECRTTVAQSEGPDG